MKTTILFIALLFGSSTLYSQNLKLNAEAKVHYTVEQIIELHPVDIAKINFYYTASFQIDTNHSFYQAFINKHCNGMFELKYFENMRAKDYESWYADEEFPGFKITLLSWDDLETAYRKIEESY